MSAPSLLAAAEVGCQRVVLAGSLEEPDCEDGEPVPVSPYAAAKFAANTYGRMFHSLHGLPVVTLRIFMVCGPAQPDESRLVPYVITWPVARAFCREAPRGRVYLDDVVDALLASATTEGVLGKTLDIGSGMLTPVRDVVEEIFRLTQPSAAPRFGAVPERQNERIPVADVERTQVLLGWVPRTPLSCGLSATVDWYTAREDAA